MAAIEVGRKCIKTAGREAGKETKLKTDVVTSTI